MSPSSEPPTCAVGQICWIDRPASDFPCFDAVTGKFYQLAVSSSRRHLSIRRLELHCITMCASVVRHASLDGYAMRNLRCDNVQTRVHLGRCYIAVGTEKSHVLSNDTVHQQHIASVCQDRIPRDESVGGTTPFSAHARSYRGGR